MQTQTKKLFGFVLGVALSCASVGTAAAATLSLHSTWAFNGASIGQIDGSNVINALAGTGSYDFSHTIQAAAASMVIPDTAYEFIDDWVFTVSGDAMANAVASTIQFGSLLGLEQLSARLYGYPGGLPVIGTPGNLLAEASGNPFTCGTGCAGEAVMLAPVTLALGTYVLELRGIVSGSVSGSYGGALNLTEVPLPGMAWLFGSALMGVGWFHRRTKA